MMWMAGLLLAAVAAAGSECGRCGPGLGCCGNTCCAGDPSLPVNSMNIGGYLFANPNNASGVQFRTDYPRRATEKYFEVYAGPITTRYGEVFWQGLPSVPLPSDIVQKYDGKTIAITGYEQDQVIRTPGKPDQSVPIYWAYNHHYVAWLKGKHATMVELDGTDKRRPTGHPLLQNAFAIDDPDPDSVIPTSQFFSEGNGGESRKSYHGYPKGFAQLLDSPTTFEITPMQIDTWNRNMSYGQPFVPGPESKASLAPLTGPDAVYSGHLECPCTDRVTKTVTETFSTQNSGKCAATVVTADECFASVSHVGITASSVTKNVTVNSESFPSGCSVVSNPGSTGASTTYAVYFNSAAASESCGGNTTSFVGMASITDAITFGLQLDTAAPGGLATITISGPAENWFGLGLGAQQMSDTPNAIICVPNGTVWEQKLADQNPGEPLPMSLKVVSNTVTGGIRTVVVSRPFKGLTSKHYTFDPSTPLINFIGAIGAKPEFSYHKSRGASQLYLKALGASTCICSTGKKAYITTDMNPAPQAFGKNCLPEPYGDLAAMHNPTCTIEQYSGGLSCCKSGNILLDKDQNPWPDNKLSYYMKWRFWYENYTPPSSPGEVGSHQNLVRQFQETERNAGEYDVVKAPAGTAPEDTVYQITAHFKLSDGTETCNPRTSPHCASNLTDGALLIYASCHCHAPSCISCELWNADTGELLCRQVPVYGKSAAATHDNPYDEKGYIAVPPCLFGSPEEGLFPPPFVAYDQNLTSIKKNNNTYGHYGEMSMWQNRWAPAYRVPK